MHVAATNSRPRTLHRRLLRGVPTPAASRSSWRGRASQALWLALASGWLEAVTVLGQRTLLGTVTRVSVRSNRYFLPLGMAAHLAIFAGWLVLSAACSWGRARSERAERLVTALGLSLAFASPLLALESLHWCGGVLLAVGLATRSGVWWARRREAIVRATLGPLIVASAVLAGLGFAWTYGDEHRSLAAPGPTPAGAPNVVLVVLDTVRADHLGLYGYARPTTPRLDALAGRSIVFEAARAPAPWTLPSHATMFTGRWPHELSVDTDRPLDGTYPTLAEFLAEHGYATGGFVGNTCYANAWFGLDRGFARYEDAYENVTISAQEVLRASALGRLLMPLAVRARLWPTTGDVARRKTAAEINRDALAWLDRRGDRPFFLFLNYMDAHDPYLLPPGFPPQFSHAGRAEVIDAQARFFHLPHDPGAATGERRAAETALARLGVDAYDDCLRYVDAQLARLLEELEGRGLLGDTWVIITADHGEQFGEHGRFGHGNSLYRPLLDVPLLIVPPRGAVGRSVAAPVSLRDLPATVADLVGLSEASPFPGRSLRRHWDGATAGPSNSADLPLSELKLAADAPSLPGPPPANRFLTAIVAGHRIYHRGLQGRVELYDLDDRREASDLATRPDAAPELERGRAIAEQFFRDAR